MAWLLGIILTLYMNFLSKLLKLKGKARKIANLITDKVQKIFKDDIWVIRCNKLKELNLLHCNLMELYRNNSKDKNGQNEIRVEDNHNEYGICFNDLNTDGTWIKIGDMFNNINTLQDSYSCETDEIILKAQDKLEWANKIVNEGLEKLVFGSYLNRNFIDWSKISDFSKLSFENLKDN